MPMKNPVHPGALAKANLDELNVSVADVAKKMQVTRQQLHNVMRGRSSVTPAMALLLKKRSAAAPTCGCVCRWPMISPRHESTNAK
jgi:addiction module HigA family antidote